MESVLMLDDGRWSRPAVDQFDDDYFLSGNMRQPSPPPVLARLQPENSHHISPSRVADPRPGPANSFQDDVPTSNTFHHLHIVSYISEN